MEQVISSGSKAGKNSSLGRSVYRKRQLKEQPLNERTTPQSVQKVAIKAESSDDAHDGQVEVTSQTRNTSPQQQNMTRTRHKEL